MSDPTDEINDVQKLGDERDFNVLELAKTIRLGLFDVSYNLGLQALSTSFNAFWSISYIVEFLQLIRFILPDDASVLVFSPSATATFRTLCGLVDAGAYVGLFGKQGAFIIACIATVLNAGAFLALVVSKELAEKGYLLKAIAICLQLLTSILYIPTLNILFAQIMTSSLLGVIGILVGLVLIFISIIAVIALPPTSVTSRSYISRASPQVELGYFLFKTICVAVCSFSSSQIVIMIVIMFGGGFLAYSYAWSLPDYNNRMLLLRSSLFSLLTWAGLVYAVAIFIDNPTVAGPVYMLFAGMPLIIGGSCVLTMMRLEFVRKMPSEKLGHPFEIELKSRLILHQAEKEAHSARIAASLAIFENDDADRNGITATANEILSKRYKETLEVFETGISKFSSSAYLQIRIAVLYFQFLKINFVGYEHLGKADALSTGIDVEYLIYRTQRDNERAILDSEANREVVEFNQYERSFKTAVNHEKALTRTLAVFWGELRQPSPDGDLLLSLADNMRKDERAARLAYKEMLKIYSRSVRTLTEYSKFLTDIAHDPGQGQRLLDRARTIEDAQNRTSVADLSFRSALFSDQSAVIVMSGDSRTLGKIINVNSAAEYLFGIPRASFIGKRVELIIPEPIARKHDMIVRRNLTTGDTRHLENRILLVILLRSGLILDAIFFLKVFVENMSTLSFLAVISATNLSDAQLVIDSRDGLVTTVSATALEFFSITKESVDAHEVKIRDLIPRYDEHQKAFLETDLVANFDVPGIEIKITVDNVVHVVNARFDVYPIDHGENAEVLRIRFRNKPSEQDSSGNAIREQDGSVSGSVSSSPSFRRRAKTRSSYSRPSKDVDSENESTPKTASHSEHKSDEDSKDDDQTGSEEEGEEEDHDEQEEDQEEYESENETEPVDETASESLETSLRMVPANTDTEKTFTMPPVDELAGSHHSQHSRSNKSQHSRHSHIGGVKPSSVQKAITEGNEVAKVKGDQSEFGATSSNVSSSVSLLLSEMSRKGRTMDRTLLNFQRIYRLAQLIIVGLIVGIAVYQYMQLFRFMSNLSLVKAASMRRTAFSQLAFLTYCMVLINHGVTLPGRLTEPFIRSNLLDSANTLVQTDDLVHSLVVTKVVDESAISLVDIRIRQGQHELLKAMSLHDAAAYIASQGQMAAILPLSQFDERSDLVYLMMQNVRDVDNSYMSALNVTANDFVDQSIIMLTSSFNIWILLSVVSIIVIVILLWMLLRPLVRTLEKDESEIMGFFLEIPIDIIQQIEKRFQDRYESFLNAQINTSFSVNDAPGGQGDHNTMLQTQNGQQKRTDRSTENSNAGGNLADIDIKQINNNRGPTRTLSIGNGNSWDRVLLLVRMYILVVIVTAYIVLVISLIVQNPANKETIHTKCGDMDYTMMRTSQSVLVLHSLILYGAGVGGDPPNQFGFSYDEVVRELNLLQLHNKFTMFGAAGNVFVGQLERKYISASEYELAFDSGCSNWQATTPTQAQCLAFDSSFMNDGLNFAIARFLQAARMAAMAFRSNRNITMTGPLPLGPYTPRTWTQVNQTLSNRDFNLATVMAIDYTFLQMEGSVDSDIANSENFFGSLGTQQIILLVAVVLASTASYFLVFQPLILSLDDGVQRTRSLLLLIPANVINSMSSIKDYVKRQQDRAS